MHRFIPFIALIVFILLKHHFFPNNAPLTTIEKLLAVSVILFYSFQHIFYGVFVCILLISLFFLLQYNLSFNEGFANTERKEENGEDNKNVLNTDSLQSEDNINTDTIPKIIIQTWKTQTVPLKYKTMVDSLRNLNPDYEYKFFSDNDIDEFLKKNYPDYYMTYAKLPIKIQKIDFFRYIAVYHFGGFYFDLDMKGLQPLDEIVLNNQCVFPVDEMINSELCKQKRYQHFCSQNMYFLLGQYAFAAKAKDPFIKLLIDNIHMNIGEIIQKYSMVANKEMYVYTTTGPDYVSNLYLQYNDKLNVKILHNNKRQYFGNYAQHKFFGTWK